MRDPMIQVRSTSGCSVAKKKARKPSARQTATTRWLSFRLPHDVAEMLDAHVVAERERTGYPLTRTQALVKILRDACS